MGDGQDFRRSADVASPFPEWPRGWFWGCTEAALRHGPRPVGVGNQELVAFRSASGDVGVLSRRCVHMGADLSLGRVVAGAIQCPLHEWKFDMNGRCVCLPAADAIPSFARQGCFPCSSRGGHVFFANQPKPAFDCPFFDGLTPDHLVPARPFVIDAELPWYMVAANGFDLQHFRAAHDRTLIDEPIVSQPHPFARRIRATFAVSGSSVRDRLTRAFSGPQVTMTVTSWAGTCVLVTAEFRRTTSYGMVWITPTSPTSCRLRVIVWVPRSRGTLGRRLFDPIDAAVRRSFIRAFVRSDQERSAGIRYTRATMIDADATLVSYMDWLAATLGSAA